MLSCARRYYDHVFRFVSSISYTPAAYAASTRGGQLIQSQMGLRVR